MRRLSTPRSVLFDTPCRSLCPGRPCCRSSYCGPPLPTLCAEYLPAPTPKPLDNPAAACSAFGLSESTSPPAWHARNRELSRYCDIYPHPACDYQRSHPQGTAHFHRLSDLRRHNQNRDTPYLAKRPREQSISKYPSPPAAHHICLNWPSERPPAKASHR